LLDLLQNSSSYLPWLSFIAGFSGSLHCLAMCGGLVTASCENTQDVYRYQVGRLLGYLVLGFFAGLLGSIFKIQSENIYLTVIPSLLIGFLFLWWGIEGFQGKKSEIPTPSFLQTLYRFVWGKWIRHNPSTNIKSFLIGFLSILLPCGLLYGVVLGLVSFEHSFKALYSMFFFWLGTLPSMVIAPKMMTKILKPIKEKLPRTFGILLMLIGLATISARTLQFEKNVQMRAKESTKLLNSSDNFMCH